MTLQLTQKDRDLPQRLEEDLWREETRFDIPDMERLLAKDFIEFGHFRRVYRREDTLSIPKQPIDAVLPLSDFNVRLLTTDIAQVTYNSAVTTVSSRHTLRGCYLNKKKVSVELSHNSGYNGPGY